MKPLLIRILLLPLSLFLFISILVSPATAQPGSKGETMPTARSDISATNIGDDIYVIGGFD